MKISAVSYANSVTFSRRKKQKEQSYHPPITYDANKARTALLYITATGLIATTILAIKDAGNNSIKTAYNKAKDIAKEIAPDPIKLAIGKKRNIDGVRTYQICRARNKLNSLEQKIKNGDFTNLPEHAKRNIEKQRDKLLRTCQRTPIL